jgi:hypothetical protein
VNAMTRRDRLVRILENFGNFQHRNVKWEFDRLLVRHGLSLFTDEAIEMLTAAVVRDWKRTQRMNRENRTRKSA